jgi:hypothetical protein
LLTPKAEIMFASNQATFSVEVIEVDADRDEIQKEGI